MDDGYGKLQPTFVPLWALPKKCVEGVSQNQIMFVHTVWQEGCKHILDLNDILFIYSRHFY